MAAAAPAPPSRWLHGPVSDVALGTGLLYVPLFAWIAVAGDPVPHGLLPLLVLALSTPHLGATLLRVYERPEDRRAYRLFAVWITAAMAGVFLLGLYVYPVGSILISVYLTMVPWHFTGQNYGISLIFLRRAGVDISPSLKRFIYAAFTIPFVLWILALHGDVPGTAEYAPLGTGGTVYEFLSIGIPSAVQAPAVWLASVVYLWVIGECVLGMRRSASLKACLPALALMLTQSLWFAAPILVHFFAIKEPIGPLAPGSAAYTFVWISLLHALQYLWITTYYARKERPGMRTVPYLAKSLLAGSALYGFPILVLAPGIAGRLPYDSGLFLMVAGALNLHHVMMDGVIWKLRNTRIASILIGGTDVQPAEADRPNPWFGRLAWASGAVAVVLTVAGTLEAEYGVARAIAGADVDRLAVAAKRLKWMGRDGPGVRGQLGVLRLESGDVDGAIREFDRSLALRPTTAAWINLGVAHERENRLAQAIEAYETALTLDPEDVTALYYAGQASLRTGRLRRARELLEQAAILAPERQDIRKALEATLQRSASLP